MFGCGRREVLEEVGSIAPDRVVMGGKAIRVSLREEHRHVPVVLFRVLLEVAVRLDVVKMDVRMQYRAHPALVDAVPAHLFQDVVQDERPPNARVHEINVVPVLKRENYTISPDRVNIGIDIVSDLHEGFHHTRFNYPLSSILAGELSSRVENL